MKNIVIALISFVFIGCSSLEKTSTIYLDALEAAKNEKNSPERSPAVHESFARACGLGNQAACLQVNPNREGLKLSRIPILQAATGPTSTQISVLIEVKSDLLFLLWDERTGQLQELVDSNVATREFSPFAIVSLRFENLKPDVRYRFEVITKNGVLLDYRHLETLSPQANKLRFALISCMSDLMDPSLQQTMWRDALSQKPEVLFFVGDEVYADRTRLGPKEADARQLWERYVETRRTLPVFYAENLIPTFSIWDDHDTGRSDAANLGDLTEPARVFRAFFPQQPIKNVLENGPGLSGEVLLAGQRFYFLDDRSFRSPNVNPKGRNGKPAPIYPESDKQNQSHLGANQEKWLIDRLQQNRIPAWLILGNQFFGGYHPFESYQGSHPKAFAKFLKSLRAVRAPFVFASGDRHLAEIIRIPRETFGFQTYELTSSGIHAKVFPNALEEDPSPHQWVGRDGTYNYMIVISEVRKNGFRIEATSYAPNKEVIFSKTWDIVR